MKFRLRWKFESFFLTKEKVILCHDPFFDSAICCLTLVFRENYFV